MIPHSITPTKIKRVLRACIEHDLSKLYDWFGANSLRLNINKTNLLLFDYQKYDKTEFSVLVNGTTLNPLKSAKFLGVIFDDKLTWTCRTIEGKIKKITWYDT